MKPDVVFVFSGYTPQSIVNQLQSHGIPVVTLDCYRLDHMVYDVKLLGKILGKEQAADTYLNDFYLKYFNLVADRVKDVPLGKRPLVYYESSDYSTSANGVINDQMIATTGGRNIASEFKIPFPKVSSEWVLAKNPQIMFRLCTFNVASGYGKSYSGMKSVLQMIMQRPGWAQHVAAVKSDKVYMIGNQLDAGPFTPITALYMAKCLYPELFKDVDPAAVFREWLPKLFGLPYNGAWFYPEPE